MPEKVLDYTQKSWWDLYLTYYVWLPLLLYLPILLVIFTRDSPFLIFI